VPFNYRYKCTSRSVFHWIENDFSPPFQIPEPLTHCLGLLGETSPVDQIATIPVIFF
jgi:hypothetical protein